MDWDSEHPGVVAAKLIKANPGLTAENSRGEDWKVAFDNLKMNNPAPGPSYVTWGTTQATRASDQHPGASTGKQSSTPDVAPAADVATAPKAAPAAPPTGTRKSARIAEKRV